MLDAAKPFTATKLITLAEWLTKSNERWAFWRNPHKDFQGVPDTSPQSHFIGARNSAFGVTEETVEDLENLFCREADNNLFNASVDGWSHSRVMQFPIRTLIPRLEKQPLAVPGKEILGRGPGDGLYAGASEKQNDAKPSPGSALQFEWGEESLVAPFINTPAWPRMDCRQIGSAKEECVNHQTHRTISNIFSTALRQMDDKWQSYCQAAISSEDELLEIDAETGALHSALILGSRLRSRGKARQADELFNRTKVVEQLRSLVNDNSICIT